ncbi:hypothetical protein OH460_08055 [Vibrio sp. Makdt]|uniref:hypothetical protein n=1 Tax=Vibrio sp. Makdt TaxID=2998828 RepID=UPI0022CD23A8|nr:hypothetical protein [Vibrio sp. Makdt]MDA0152251.1 hypothetical protein [Vibrio sp. Makdt]
MVICPKCSFEVLRSDNDWFCLHCDTTKIDVDNEARGYGVATAKIISSEDYRAPKNQQQCMEVALKHILSAKPNLNKDVQLAKTVAFSLSNELEIAEKLRDHPAVQLTLGNINESLKRSISKHPMVKRMNELYASHKLKFQFTDISNSAGNEVIASFDGFGLETIPQDLVADWLEFRNWLNAAAKKTDLVIQERFESYAFKKVNC